MYVFNAKLIKIIVKPKYWHTKYEFKKKENGAS